MGFENKSNDSPSSRPKSRSMDGGGGGYKHNNNNDVVHYITKKNTVRKSSREKRLVTETWYSSGILYGAGVRPLEPIVHRSINAERSIPAKRNVDHVPLGDTPIVAANNFVLLAPVLVLKLGLAPDVLLDPEEFPASVSCPEITESKEKGRILDYEPLYTTY